MDDYALESLKRANRAIVKGHFTEEITAIDITHKGSVTTVENDEQPGKARPEKIPTLKPVFQRDGTITAANSSSISDGAAALMIVSAAKAQELDLVPLAKISGHATHAHLPGEFTTAPVQSISKLLEKLNWSSDMVDLYEINEAFAMVTMLAIKKLNLDHMKVNVNGGACALGHPIGCSGARILVTLLYALKNLEKKRGVASLCIGGGEATSIAIEML